MIKNKIKSLPLVSNTSLQNPSTLTIPISEFYTLTKSSKLMHAILEVTWGNDHHTLKLVLTS